MMDYKLVIAEHLDYTKGHVVTLTNLTAKTNASICTGDSCPLEAAIALLAKEKEGIVLEYVETTG